MGRLEKILKELERKVPIAIGVAALGLLSTGVIFKGTDYYERNARTFNVNTGRYELHDLTARMYDDSHPEKVSTYLDAGEGYGHMFSVVPVQGAVSHNLGRGCIPLFVYNDGRVSICEPLNQLGSIDLDTSMKIFTDYGDSLLLERINQDGKMGVRLTMPSHLRDIHCDVVPTFKATGGFTPNHVPFEYVETK